MDHVHLLRRPLAQIILLSLACSAMGCRSFNPADPPVSQIVIAIAEPEYETDQTLPALAEKLWTPQRGYNVSVIIGDPSKHDIPGLAAAVRKADVLVLSIRRQALPRAQLQAVRDHLVAGKPLLAIRTSSHAFVLRDRDRGQLAEFEGRSEWPQFDAEVIGGNYHGHYPNGQSSTVNAVPDAIGHPILAGIELPLTSNAGVYKNNPLSESAQPLLVAQFENKPPEPVAWTHLFGQARVFYTSLGNPDDFNQRAFQRLLDQAMQWLCKTR